MISSPTVEYQKAVTDFFKSEIAATKLIEGNSKILEPSLSGPGRILCSLSGAQIYWVEKEDQILELEVTWNGMLLEWEKGLKIKISLIQEDSRESNKYAQSSMIKALSPIPVDVSENFLRFLIAAPVITEEIKNQIKKIFEI